MSDRRVPKPRTDAELREFVLAELLWNPYVREDQLAVDVRDGIVTLSGRMPSWNDRVLAEQVTQRVNGIAAVTNAIEIRQPEESA